MSNRKTSKAKRVLAALEKIGWRVKRRTGSHKVLEREGFEDYIFVFHDGVEIGSVMLSKITEKTGLEPEDL